VYNAGQARVKYSTISNNHTGRGYLSVPLGGDGGGLHNEGSFFEIQSSIVAGNEAEDGGHGHDLYGDFESDSQHNLIGTEPGTDYSGLDHLSNYKGINPQLKVFGDYGGPMATCEPLSTSPALESGHCPGEITDQRGFPRPIDHPIDVDTDAECDIGAVEAHPPLEAAIKVYLEGPYTGDGMSNALALHVPFAHPYYVPPWYYFGAETLGSSPQADLVDWVLVSLASGDPLNPPMTVLRTHAALLTADGMIEDAEAPGTDRIHFEGVLPGSFHVIVRHRNHLDVMSASEYALDDTAGGVIDFTATDKCYGINPVKELGGSPGLCGMWAGDGEVDGEIQALDFNRYLAETISGATGYRYGDFNMDGIVQALDFNFYLANTLAGASSQVP
jgi:hypothetical protein